MACVKGSLQDTHKAIQLGDRGLVARMTDIPHLYAAFTTGVDVACGVTNGDSTHHLSVAERINLPCMARNAWTNQRIGRERHRLHLSVSTHMKGVGSEEKGHMVV